MTATALKKSQPIEPDEGAVEPLEEEDELLDEDEGPEVEPDGPDDFDTCSPVAAGSLAAGWSARMLVKRSLSPTGHIDSVSVEIDLPIGGLSAQEIRARGIKALQLEN